jgi:AcrR family transcriptional regulator
MGSQELDLSELELDRHAPDAAAVLHRALIDLCFDRGFAAVSAEALCQRADLSSATFRSRHGSLERYFVQACRDEIRRYRGLAAAAASEAEDWRGRLRAVAYALYRSLGGDERRRHFILIEARAGERSALLIDRALSSLYDLIDEGRAQPAAPARLTRATAEFLGGAAFNEVYLASGRRSSLPREEDVVPKMMYLTVLPYLGGAEALKELTTPPPQPQPYLQMVGAAG